MKQIKSLDGLAKAMEEQGWTASKTTDKTVALMSGLSNIPWEKVKLFTLRWTTSGGQIVPELNIMMFRDGEEFEDSEVEVDIKIPIDQDIPREPIGFKESPL